MKLNSFYVNCWNCDFPTALDKMNFGVHNYYCKDCNKSNTQLNNYMLNSFIENLKKDHKEENDV